MRPAVWPIRSLARGTSKLPREMPWRSASWNRPRRRYAARSRLLLLCARRVSARSSFLLMTCRLDWSCACWRTPPRSAGLAADTSPKRVCPWHRRSGVPTQMPAAHTSFVVHGLPSSHALVLYGYGQPVAGTQPPVVGSQVSMPSHASPLSQLTYVPRQTPLAHTSLVVHGLPSSHETVALGVCTQPTAGSQLSSVQVFASSQTGGVPGRHAPVVGSQVSTPVHASWSSHVAAVPRMQSPFTQV